MAMKVVLVALLVAGVASGRRLLDSGNDGSQTLPRYAQCGGTGGNCDQYSACSNSPYEGFTCSDGDVCNTVNDSYWQCMPAGTSVLQIDAYAQCGGINCQPVLGDSASQIACENAPWSGTVCSESSTTCRRLDDFVWQCLPTDSAAAEASPEEEAAPEEASPEEEASPKEEVPPEEASPEEEAAPEEEPAPEEASPEEPAAESTPEASPEADSEDSEDGLASVLSQAKTMGAKALGGVKTMGTKAVDAVKSMAADTTKDNSPSTQETQPAEPSPDVSPAASNSPQPNSEAGQVSSSNQIAPYAQCGGINCLPALGDSASDITCENAAWADTVCSDSSTSCQRVDDYMWQCLPANSAASESSPEASPAAETGSEEEGEASVMGSAKAMGAKALGGAKAMGAKVMDAAQSMVVDEEDQSPAPAQTQAAQTSNDDLSADAAPLQDESDQDSSLELLILPDGDAIAEDGDSSNDSDTDLEESGELDIDILTFAFNMECLQTALYSCALYGDAGPVTAVSGCTSANLPDGYMIEETRELSLSKKQHVEYLQSVLQIPCPAIDLGAFTAVANAAVDVGSNQTFNALTPEFTVAGSPMNIILAGFFLEDVAVSMYQGLIPNIVSRDLLIAATGIMVDNTYHAGTVRDVAAMSAASQTGYTMMNAATNATADAQLNVHDFVGGMAQLRDMLDNTNDDNIAISNDTGLASLSGKRSATGVNTDHNGITHARTPGQVLAIALGNSNSGTSSGLFFPQGVAGSNPMFTNVS